jgi:hypothetical protein
MSSVPGGRPRTGDFQDVWLEDVLLVKSNIYIGFVRLLKTSLSVARWSFDAPATLPSLRIHFGRAGL